MQYIRYSVFNIAGFFICGWKDFSSCKMVTSTHNIRSHFRTRHVVARCK